MYKLECPMCKQNKINSIRTIINNLDIDSHIGFVLPKQEINNILEYTCTNCRYTGKPKEFIKCDN